MRVLSLLQPWASLWVAGAKRIETRSWGTAYRGPVAVHASKALRQSEVQLCHETPFREALVALGFTTVRQLPRGALIGVVELVDCLRMVAGEAGPGEIGYTRDTRLDGNESDFGNYDHGRWAWMTGDVRSVLAAPIPMRGSLGLRDLAPGVVAQLAAPPQKPGGTP